eukprot:gnl/MRDRNA2_/MRDRNA2_86590_c1_seq10.p1 gnl/MRDRNA2_/MRDRNA2_86590_c1~~gnl/MRDRNA2_/MRDRNA2_86590_c1_seq10.p1  ORF type:complete len:459 (+),score=-35.57 gnl/MRDRNA2_/MRDRNA2_86590_c1_seq10:126-1502(+)
MKNNIKISQSLDNAIILANHSDDSLKLDFIYADYLLSVDRQKLTHSQFVSDSSEKTEILFYDGYHSNLIFNICSSALLAIRTGYNVTVFHGIRYHNSFWLWTLATVLITSQDNIWFYWNEHIPGELLLLSKKNEIFLSDCGLQVIMNSTRLKKSIVPLRSKMELKLIFLFAELKSTQLKPINEEAIFFYPGRLSFVGLDFDSRKVFIIRDDNLLQCDFFLRYSKSSHTWPRAWYQRNLTPGLFSYFPNMIIWLELNHLHFDNIVRVMSSIFITPTDEILHSFDVRSSKLSLFLFSCNEKENVELTSVSRIERFQTSALAQIGFFTFSSLRLKSLQIQKFSRMISITDAHLISLINSIKPNNVYSLQISASNTMIFRSPFRFNRSILTIFMDQAPRRLRKICRGFDDCLLFLVISQNKILLEKLQHLNSMNYFAESDHPYILVRINPIIYQICINFYSD